jgi:hypothetical protein
MKRTSLFLAGSLMLVTAACKQEAPPPKAVPSAPPVTQPVLADRPVDGGATIDAGHGDAKLTMMERHAIWKAKKEADAKLTAQLAADEKARLMKFDLSKLAKHQSMFAFERSTRQALDQAAQKLNGKLDAADQLKKLATSKRKAIDTQISGLRAMDPKGGSSAIGTDHDVVLHLLAEDYPAAIVSFFQGETKPLAEVRAEMDKREKKIAAWLDELESSKK